VFLEIRGTFDTSVTGNVRTDFGFMHFRVRFKSPYTWQTERHGQTEGRARPVMRPIKSLLTANYWIAKNKQKYFENVLDTQETSFTCYNASYW